MPKCPKCKAEIDSAHYYESGLMVFQKGEWLKNGNPDIETICPNAAPKLTSMKQSESSYSMKWGSQLSRFTYRRPLIQSFNTLDC